MNMVVLGLWHVGSVTAACCVRHFQVTGLDFDADNAAKLSAGRAPLFELGVDELIAAGLAAGKLAFSTDPTIACASADMLLLTYNTPVNENDESDMDFVLGYLRRALPYLPSGAPVLIWTQLLAGTCRRLES